jgi:hypothetical protein
MRLFFQHHDCKNNIHSENSGFMIPQSKLQDSSNGISSIKEEPSKVNDGEEDADDDAEIPGSTESTTTEKMATRMLTKNNPVIITLYGQMCLAAKSYQNAICKLADYSGEFLVTIFQFICCMHSIIATKTPLSACCWPLLPLVEPCSDSLIIDIT